MGRIRCLWEKERPSVVIVVGVEIMAKLISIGHITESFGDDSRQNLGLQIELL